jgi:hypothetical protein
VVEQYLGYVLNQYSKITYIYIYIYIYREREREREMIKRTLVQALRLCTGRTTHRGKRGIALPFLDHGTRKR